MIEYVERRLVTKKAIINVVERAHAVNAIIKGQVGMTIPSTKKTSKMSRITVNGGRPAWIVKVAIMKGSLLNAMKLLIMSPLIRRKKTMLLITIVEEKLSIKLCLVKPLRLRPIMRAPKAPIPAASVGVKTPMYRPPTTSRNSISMGQTPLAATSFSLMLTPGARGPRLGLSVQIRVTVVMNKTAISNPGKIPAMKSLPIDCSVRSP